MNSSSVIESQTDINIALKSRQTTDVLLSDSTLVDIKSKVSHQSVADLLSPMVSTSFVTDCHQSAAETTVLATNSSDLTDCNSYHQPNGCNGYTNGISDGINGTNDVGTDTSSMPSTNTSMAQLSQSLPFPLLSGETLVANRSTTDGILYVTNYRLFLSYISSKERLPISLPIGMIESVEMRDLYYLNVYTKHVRSFIISFTTGEDCAHWYKRLLDICSLQTKLDNLFCFKFFVATKADKSHIFVDNKQIRNCYENFYKEFKRMSFDNVWRISDINKEFKLCQSYPRYLVVPQSVTDKDLESVASFRYSRRIPTVVWRHRKNGCVISRSSQPEVGWLGWRSSHDELLLNSIVKCCNIGNNIAKKLLILDARSYTAAVANRAKGGGCECPEYYLDCEVQFMSLANIHSIRKSFYSLRYICESPADQINWLTLLDNTKWLHNLSGLMKSALIVVNAIDLEERPVLVHCSDGWDRTPQIVALAELMLDPYYRTIDGFRMLIEREWIKFGHKFADRCGNGASCDDTNERCPVFLQWLDCVHQLVLQFPCSFEFNLNFLIKLIQHTYSSLFGTFICNNIRERIDHQIYEKTYSVWSYFNNRRQYFINYIYANNDQVLRPSCKAKDIVFWSDVYMPLSSSASGGLEYNYSSDDSVDKNNVSYGDVTDGNDVPINGDIKQSNESKQLDTGLNVSNNETNETESDMDTIASDKHHSLSKTRSCENLALDDHHTNHHNDDQHYSSSSLLRTRHHCSDPNLQRSLTIANDSVEWKRGKCADIIQYIRDYQTNGIGAGSREASDRDSTQFPSSRNSDNGLLDDSDLVMASHFSMLSTETLLNGNIWNNGECIQTNGDSSQNVLLNHNVLTTSTSTTELSSSCVQNNDSLSSVSMFDPILKKRQQTTHTCSTPVQRQNSNEINNSSSSYGYSNGKHTRTPSSGCPATPNDESNFDNAFPFDGALNHESFDIDGHLLLKDKVLSRLQQIIGQNKIEIDYLRRELYLARLALCQQLKYCNGVNDESSIANGSNSSETSDNVLNSWVDVMPSLQQTRNGFIIKSRCDNKSHSFTSIDPEVNAIKTCDELSLDTNQLALSVNHL